MNQNQNVQTYNQTGATKPEKKIRAGAISATIWKNTKQKDGKSFDYRSVSFERSYKDKSGQWKTTNSLSVQDLPKARAVIEEAYKYLIFNTNTASETLSETTTEEVMI
ncbi:MAG: hypothetical protein AABX39_02595 [Nanoarchaeota archaeon]